MKVDSSSSTCQYLQVPYLDSILHFFRIKDFRPPLKLVSQRELIRLQERRSPTRLKRTPPSLIPQLADLHERRGPWASTHHYGMLSAFADGQKIGGNLSKRVTSGAGKSHDRFQATPPNLVTNLYYQLFFTLYTFCLHL